MMCCTFQTSVDEKLRFSSAGQCDCHSGHCEGRAVAAPVLAEGERLPNRVIGKGKRKRSERGRVMPMPIANPVVWRSIKLLNTNNSASAIGNAMYLLLVSCRVL